MNPSLQGQMDYIFFFYGLAFIGLGVVAHVLSKEVNQRLPWRWLALFGFTHGFNEWLDLLALVLGDSVWFGACRWALMAVSFVCLLEFGRLSGMSQRGRGPGRIVLGILVAVAALGGLEGWNGLNAASRYALGLTGSLWAGWALFAEAKTADPRCRFWLVAGGLGFGLYGLATGVVVPRAPFWPATVINYQTFTSLTGLPIQLMRGLLAVGIAAAVAGYFQAAWPATYERCHRYRARYLFGVSGALVVILTAGWLLTHYLDGWARKDLVEESVLHSRLLTQAFASDLTIAEDAVMTLAGSPWISPALWDRSPQTMDRANAVLDRYQQRFKASVAYLLDADGTTVASSNRNAPDSFVGQSYAFRPYFQEAMAGSLSRYFALGVTSKKRGFYAASAVKDPEGKVIGVVVLKMTLFKFSHLVQKFDPALLVDPQGIVFMSSRADLDFHSLSPLIAPDEKLLQAQYGTKDIATIFPQPLVEGREVKLGAKTYISYHHPLEIAGSPGWSLVLLRPINQLVFFRLLGIGFAFILVVLTLVAVGTNLSVREGANRILASEARFRAMFASAPEAVFVYDPETRKIVDANPFMAQWLGYQPEELLNLEIDAVMVPDTPETAAEGSPEGQTGPQNRRYRRRDGSLVDVEMTTAGILHGDHFRELAFVRDITERKRAEADLKKERDFISTLLDTIGALVVVLDPQGHIVRFNRACEQISGYALEEMEGTLVWDRLVPPEEVAAVQNTFGTLLKGNVPGEIENYWVTRDGQRRLIAWSNTSIKDAGGNVTHVIGTGIDVTARRQAENEVRQAKEYLENILDNSADPIGIVDQRGKILKWNKASEQVFGYSFSEMRGSSSFGLYADQDQLQTMVGKLRRKGSVRGYEISLKKKDGSIAPFALSINLLYDRNHKAIGSVCVARDLSKIKKAWDDLASVNEQLQHEVSERKQMEAALQEANRSLQRVLAEVESRNRAMTLSNEMSDVLQACVASEEAYNAISHFMPKFFPEDSGALYMVNNSRNLFEAAAVWGQDKTDMPVFAPDECWSVRRGRMHRADNPREALGCRHLPPGFSRGYLCVPLIAQGETLGTLHIRLGPQAEAQDPGLALAKEQLALTVAEDMALALANLRLRETLRSQAIRDVLTGLFNRRYMEETLERELNRVMRSGTPLGVIMMDLDHFKNYNDTFGHSAGDELLSALGALLKSHIRSEDIACRYGGEEFLLILPGTSLEVAVERAELLRQAVQELHLQHPSLKPASLSLGVAVFPHHGRTGLDLIKAADAALYRAKQNGRNRAVVAESPGDGLRAHLVDPPALRETA